MGKEKDSIESRALKLIIRLANLESNIKNNLQKPDTIYTAGDVQINEFIRNIDRFKKIVPDLKDFDDGDADWLDELLRYQKFLKEKGERATTSDTLNGCIEQIVQMKQKLQPFTDYTLERNRILEGKNCDLEQKVMDQEKEINELKDKLNLINIKDKDVDSHKERATIRIMQYPLEHKRGKRNNKLVGLLTYFYHHPIELYSAREILDGVLKLGFHISRDSVYRNLKVLVSHKDIVEEEKNGQKAWKLN